MGPTKAIVKENALYEAVSGKLIQAGFGSRREIDEHVKHHYLRCRSSTMPAMPGRADGKPIYCLHGVQYETLDDQKVHLARCPDCGGMGSAPTSSPSNRIAFAASPAGMSLTRGSK